MIFINLLASCQLLYIVATDAYGVEPVKLTPLDQLETLSFDERYEELKLRLMLMEWGLSRSSFEEILKKFKLEATQRRSKKALLLLKLIKNRFLFNPDTIQTMETYLESIKNELLQSGGRFFISRYYYNKGLIASFLNNDEIKAISNYKKALSYYDDKEKNLEKYAILNYMTQSYRISGQRQLSIEAAKKNLEILRGRGLGHQESLVRELLGDTFRDLGQYAQAMDYLFESLKYYTESNNVRSQVSTLYSIANIKNTLGEHESALVYYKLAINLFSRHEIYPHLKSQIYYNLSNTYYALNKPDKAKEVVEKSLAIALEHNNFNSIIFSKVRLAELENFSNRPRESIKIIESLNDIDDKHWTKFSRVRKFSHLAESYLQLKNYKKAEENLEEALRLGEKFDTAANLMALYNLAVKLYTKQGDYKKIHEAYKRAKEIEIKFLKETNKQQFYAKEIAFKDNENKILSKENKIKDLQLKQRDTQTMFFAFIFISILVFFALIYSSMKKSKLLQIEKLNSAVRMRRLQDEMQPHFLFNSLNVISNLMYESIDKADDAVVRLSEMYRLILLGSHSYTWILSNEIRLIENYLVLQVARFEEKITYDINYHDVDIHKVECPCLMLHTLVENAIKHGVALNTDGGHVAVDISCEGSGYLLSVENTGSGDSPTNEAGTGTGIENTKQRLLNMYGSKSNLILQFGAESSKVQFFISGKKISSLM